MPDFVVTAQQSRFHDVGATSSEIDVKDLAISIGQRELLTGASLLLKPGHKYVLIGRNGVGKSTLLKALAGGRIPGVSWDLRILLLGQTIIEGQDDNEAVSPNASTLEYVVRSDAVRERAMKEVALLNAAFEIDTVVRTVRALRHERKERELKLARLISDRRSGARGAVAKKELNMKEAEVALSKLQLDEDDVDAATLEAETNAASLLLADLQSKLEAMDAGNAELRASEILRGLGFSEERVKMPFNSLSGGWQTRCKLAATLFQHADILLLDEPTNFLDLKAVLWLEEYVSGLDCTVVVITHDRDFADAIGEDLLILRKQKIETFHGNVSTFERDRAEQIKYKTRMQDALDKQKDHIQQSIANNMKAGKRSGDDKKVKQAVSRQKKLDDRWGMQVNEKGHRFKLNRDYGGYSTTGKRKAIEIPDLDAQVRISFPKIPAELRFPGAIVGLEKVSFGYKGIKDDQVIFRDVDLVIYPGERVGIAGLNGAGKSTLINVLTEELGAGAEKSRKPTMKGSITRHPRARIGKFSQHEVEKIEALGRDDPSITAVKEMMKHDLEEPEARAILGSLGLSGVTAANLPLQALSGGQKVRLALAKLVYTCPHLLVLDEVTTHLDADTITALIEALQGYEGAILVVTHDRYFMRCVVEGEPAVEDEEEEDPPEIPSGRVYRLSKKELKPLKDGMREYEELVRKGLNRRKNDSTVK